MATPYQSIDPALLALQTAKKAMPASSNTQQKKKQVLQSNMQQSQAPFTTSPVAPSKIGGISSPFGAANINSSPILGGATPQEIGTTATQLQSLPKAMPDTGATPPDMTQSLKDLKATIPSMQSIDDIKGAFPEFSNLDDSVLLDLVETTKNSDNYEDILSVFPELQGSSLQKQGGAKGIIAPTGGFNIPQIKPIAPTTEGNYNPLKTIANAPGSLLNVGINIANMGLSPLQTIKTLAKTAIGGATNLGEIIGEKFAGKENYNELQKKLLQGEGPLSDLYRFMNESGDVASQVGDYFKGYGDPEELQRRVEEDPAGVLSDVLSIAGMAGGTIAKAGEVSKLGKIAKVGKALASVEKYDPYNLIPKGASQMANKSGILGGVGKAAEGLVNPIASLKRSYNEVAPLLPGLKNNVAKRLLNSGIKITDTNKKAIVKSSGKEWTDFALENDIVGSVDDMITKTDDLISTSMETKLKTLQDIKTTTPVTQTEKLIANSIVSQAKNDIEALYGKPFDEIEQVEIVPELQDIFNVVNNVQKTIDGGVITPVQKEALKSLYDAYNSHLKYDQAKNRILSGAEKIRLSLQKQIEDIGSSVGVDIKGLNKKIAGGYALKKGLIQAGNRMDNLNMFGLSDSQTAILSTVLGGSPLQVAGTIVGKGMLESIPVKSRMAKFLYTKGLNEVTDNIPSNRTTASSNISSQFSSSDTSSVGNKTNDVKFPIKLSQEGLQTKGATLPKPTVKTPIIVAEKGNYGMGTPKIKQTAKINQNTTNTPSVSTPKKGISKLGKETLEQNIDSIKTKSDYPERKNRQRESAWNKNSPVKFTSGTRPTYKRHIDGYIGDYDERVRDIGAGFYDIFGGFKNVPKVKLDFNAGKSYYDDVNNLLITKKHSGTEFNVAVQDYLEKKTGILFDDYAKLPSAKPITSNKKEDIFINQLKTAQKYSDKAKETYGISTIKRNIKNIENSNRIGNKADEELSRREKQLEKAQKSYQTKQNQFENAVVNAKELGVKTIISLDQQGIPVAYFETPKGQVSFHIPNYGYNEFNKYNSVSELEKHLPDKIKNNVELLDNYKWSGLTNSKEIIEKLSYSDFKKKPLPPLPKKGK